MCFVQLMLGIIYRYAVLRRAFILLFVFLLTIFCVQILCYILCFMIRLLLCIFRYCYFCLSRMLIFVHVPSIGLFLAFVSLMFVISFIKFGVH